MQLRSEVLAAVLKPPRIPMFASIVSADKTKYLRLRIRLIRGMATVQNDTLSTVKSIHACVSNRDLLSAGMLSLEKSTHAESSSIRKLFIQEKSGGYLGPAL